MMTHEDDHLTAKSAYQEPSLPTVDAGTNPCQTSMSGDDSPIVWGDWLGIEGECFYDLFDLQDSGLVAA